MNCHFCGHPDATRRSERNPGEVYCVEIWACIDRRLKAQPETAKPELAQEREEK